KSGRERSKSIAPSIPKINEEPDLYRALGLDFIPPELRENCGEFEAAESGKLPRLIELENLRGTFHCHTTASDGHNSLEAMFAGLDFVVASVHSTFNLSEAEMTKRVIRAITNPFVTMLAHPTGRLLLKREGYAIDIPAVLDAAAETGTWIELNAAPKRLDLD